MLYKVVTKYNGVTRTHFRSHNQNDCWNFVNNQSYPYSTMNYVVIDAIDRVVKKPNKKDKYDQDHRSNISYLEHAF